ncbi:MAG: 4-hydroxyphenylpyruvate dioxygenase [Betaproteobacteria bacterium]|jgi:IclR family transcriptional regulator, pca regulon regulatory protein|nr:4-hydroxyphenylpyruvate dioxygenase [Betaproteobacteria bacterium]NBP44937.1 4-hydroxyphenylpyruvate dioxygenase [Betaproteobacteria bacterium]
MIPAERVKAPESIHDKSELLRRDWIAGLERGFGVIECFDESHPRLTAQQVGELSGLTRTAARRYLLTLASLGYVASDGKSFWLTPRVLRLGQHYLESARLPRIAQPYLQRLSTQTGEIAMLSVLDGMDCVYIARNGPNRAMNSGFVLGSRVPGYTTSAGMLMLAHQSVEAIDEWLAKTPLPAFTDYTITDPVLMRRILMQIRQQGWSLSEQQFDVGFRGVAFALRDHRGDMVGALSLNMPMQGESSEAVVARVLPALRETAQALRNLI